MKVIALLPVKNEEWCLEFCLKSLSFADSIIAIDDNSTDSTLEILKKYNCTIIPFETNAEIGWREYAIRTKLLESARQQKATHIISIDADESCSEIFQINARKILYSLKSGQTLELEWLNLCSKTEYKTPTIFKSFAFCDDGVSSYKTGFIGISRVPITDIKPLRIGDDCLIFHYQYIDAKRCQYKQAWYMISEFLNKDKSARKINNIYNHANKISCKKISDSNKLPKALPEICSNNIWQKEKIFEKVREYGIEYFEPLDIWQIEELKEEFLKTIKRTPKIKKFPKWLITLNDIKNKLKNFLK